MEKIKVYDKAFVPYISYEEISKDIDALAAKLNRDYGGGDDIPILLCVLNGAMMFTGEIMKRLDFECELMSIKLKSYSGSHSTGVIRETMGLTGDVAGRRVIIVEDIVDTGNTMAYLLDMLKDAGAKDTKICTMLFKREIFKKDFPVDYIAREIPNKFILGFGLDYDERGRCHKDIYILEQ